MDVIQAVKMYITKMTEESGPGMKVILMDKETTSIVSMVYSQSEILQKEVYLFERIDSASKWDNLKHMKCIVFVRPTSENIALLSRELRHPKYGVYFIYFSNVISKADIKTLAECDEQETVREVQEVFADYLAVDRHLFSFNIVGCLHGKSWKASHLQRCSAGLVGVVAALRRGGRVALRHEAGSAPAAALAARLRDLLRRDLALLDTQPHSHTTLLILDRRDDPVTPLLSQWTYQAMVHELLGINNNRVSLAALPDVPPDCRELVLAAEQDDFYAKNLYSNFGEIGQTMKSLMEEFQKKAKSHQKVESIADMKNFVETYPLFKKMSGTVTRHVTVMGGLSALVATRQLLQLSELEQELACHADHTKHLQQLKSLLSLDAITHHDATKLVCLYALRYEKHSNNALPSLIEQLKARGAGDELVQTPLLLLEYAGAHARQSDLFGLEDAAKITKRLFKGLQGVENIYTQHKPLLKDTLEDLIKGKLRENLYPTLGGEDGYSRRPQEIIVFIVGGATYEEALCVHQINQANPGVKVILGGTTIHNSASFFDEVRTAMQGVHRTHTRHIRNV